MNKCIFLGRMTKDSEVRVSQSGMKVARNSIAIDRGKTKDGQDRGADFLNILAFDKRAEFMEKYCTKGRKFMIEAHAQSGSYEKDGQKVYTTDFIVDSIEFADSKPEPQQSAPAPSPVDADGFMSIPNDIDEDELPFV